MDDYQLLDEAIQLLETPQLVWSDDFEIIYRDRAVDHRFRDNIMYQAGRYSMGATDTEATNGHKVATNLISKEGKK